MDAAELGGVANEALRLALFLSAPALIASVLVGLAMAVVQTATQVQDAALSFVPRLLAVAVALLAAATWMSERLVTFTAAMWREIPRLLL